MTEICWQELALAVLALIGWCIIIIVLVDTWATRQYHKARRLSKTEVQTINRELIAQVQSNTAAVEKVHKLLEMKLLELGSDLEWLLDNSRQISSIDIRTIEIARTVRKVHSIECQLGEALRNNRRRPGSEYRLNLLDNGEDQS